MFWNVVLWVGSLALSALLRPRPPDVPRPNASDIRVPVSQEGKEVGWLFGTRDLPLNVVWWGHMRTIAIKKKGGKK